MSKINPFTDDLPDLDEAIANTFKQLADLKPTDDGYRTAVDTLTKLHAIKNSCLQYLSEAEKADRIDSRADDSQTFEQLQETRPFYERVDPNTVLTVAGNLILGFAVIKYEKFGVVTSKVMTFMKKI